MDLAQLTQDLQTLADETVAAVAAAADVATLETLELDVLGKKGRLTEVLRGIGRLPADDRPKLGAVANAVRQRIEAALTERRAVLGSAELDARLAAETIDVTMPGRPIRRGSLHPSIESMAEIARIFGQFGFQVYESPEVEDDLHNFQDLNIPPDHPARDLWDTLYVDVPGTCSGPTHRPGRSMSCGP